MTYDILFQINFTWLQVPSVAVDMRLIIIALGLSFVVSPLLTDVSNISSSVTVATTSLTQPADLGELKDYQSNQTIKSWSSFDRDVSQKAINKSSFYTQRLRLIKSSPTNGTQEDVIKQNKTSELVGTDNRTLELTSPLVQDTDTKSEPQVVSKLTSHSNTSKEIEEDPRDANSFKFIARSLTDFDDSDPFGTSAEPLPPPHFQQETDDTFTFNDTSKKRTDCDNIAVSNSMQQRSLNKTISDNETVCGVSHATMVQEALDTSSSNIGQVTAASTSGIDNDFDIALTFTCRDRCGMKISFPCSCSATCVVYGTCCDNLAKDCPHVWEEGTIKFDHLHSVGLTCDDDFVYKISTCPSLVQGNVQQEQGKWSSLRREITQTTEKRVSFNADSIPETKAAINSSLTSPTTKDARFQESLIQTFTNALSSVPITDSDTGFTFVNRAVYDCHNMSQSTAMPWSLRFDYNFTSPSKLENFDHFKSLSDYYPNFNKNIFKAHLCNPDIIETCYRRGHQNEANKMFADKCHSSNAIVASRNSQIYYRNRFCAYCNEGRHTHYILMQRNNVWIKRQDFFVLMSLSGPKSLSFRLTLDPSFKSSLQFPWSQATCSIPNQGSSSPGVNSFAGTPQSDGHSVCSITCKHPDFMVRPDGVCKARHEALVAVADDGLAPLCPSAIARLATFLACGLEKEVKSLNTAEVSAESASAMFDSTYGKTLYVVKLHMELPEKSEFFFSNFDKDIPKNIRQTALLVRSFQYVRKLQNLCPGQEGIQSTGLKTIHTSSLADTVLQRIGTSVPFSQVMEELRGPIVDNQMTATVCLSFVSIYSKNSPLYLYCMEDLLYEHDASLINKLRNSSCVSHLDSLGRNKAVAVVEDNRGSLALILSLLFLFILFLKTTNYFRF
ncbi:hypothetical protein PoB_001353600 [Plakobranchus ocellatus]|uniref:SMB domain-containing protein n=1 Tax=Plakobranchus ocellatus TaxID=259542 RepID=A0AAV3YUC5_9GAST|nr:hypothetical protein PoB_001353600 [Plakobranchus ocellatus]